MKESSGSSGLRTYVLTRFALALPTVLILLTVVFLLMRVAPGDPITAALGARLPAKELEKRKKEAGYDKPILAAVRRVPRPGRHPRPRRVGHRQPLGHLDHRRERHRDPRADPGRVHDHPARRDPARAPRRALSATDPGTSAVASYGIVIYAFPVFFLGFLFQLLAVTGRLADLGPGEPDRRVRPRTRSPTSI